MKWKTDDVKCDIETITINAGTMKNMERLYDELIKLGYKAFHDLSIFENGVIVEDINVKKIGNSFKDFCFPFCRSSEKLCHCLLDCDIPVVQRLYDKDGWGLTTSGLSITNEEKIKILQIN